MFGSDRGKHAAIRPIGALIIAALGIAAYWAMFYSMGYGSGYNERKAKVESQHYASETPKQIERECGVKSDQTTRECITKIVEAEREGQRNESDLAAQWKAADWVMWAGVLAGAQLIATTAGLYFVKRTLDATLEAVEDTGEATRAMQEANEIAKDLNRPWLELGSIQSIEFIRGEGESLHSVSFTSKVVNHGNAPATFAVIHARIIKAWGYRPLDEIKYLFGKAIGFAFHGDTIYPQQVKMMGSNLRHAVRVELASTTKERNNPNAVVSYLLVFAVTYSSPTNGKSYYTARIVNIGINDLPDDGINVVHDDGTEHHGERLGQDGSHHYS